MDTPPKLQPSDWRIRDRWADVFRWASDDALNRLRAWSRTLDRKRPVLLFILHANGGGTYRYAKAVAETIGRAATVLYGIGIDERTFILCHDPDRPAEGIAFNVPNQSAALLSVTQRLGVARINIFHTVGFELRLSDLLKEWDIPYDITLTDLYLATERGRLFNDNGHYVGDHSILLASRRERPDFVAGAARIVTCSRYLAARMRAFWPDLDIVASVPIDILRGKSPRWQPVRPGEPMRVLMIDATEARKGLSTWLTVAATASADGLPLEFHIVTSTPGLQPPGLPNVFLHQSGTFDSASTTAAVVRTVGPHLAWFPFQVPETHSFAVSDAMVNRLPILASAIGAVPERLVGRPLSWLMPHDTAPEAWLEMIVRLRQAPRPLPPTGGAESDLPAAQAFFPKAYLKPLNRPRWWQFRPVRSP